MADLKRYNWSSLTLIYLQIQYCLFKKQVLLSLQGLSSILHSSHGFIKRLFEHFVDVLSSAGWNLKVLVALLLSVGNRICRIHFFRPAIAFIAHQHYHRIFRVYSGVLHEAFPSAKIGKRLSILQVEDKQYDLRIFIEGIANLLIISTAAEVEEVDCYFPARNSHFLDSIVHSDGCYVFLHEPPLAVTFDDARFAHLCITHGDQLPRNSGTFSNIWLPSIF